MTDDPKFKLTWWEAVNLNAKRVNRERDAYYSARLRDLEALLPEDREWLAAHGYDADGEIMRCTVERMMVVGFR